MLRNGDKQIFGWAMYDWANSAFVTTVAVGILPIYFAEVVVPAEGFLIGVKGDWSPLFSNSLFNTESELHVRCALHNPR